MLLNAGVVRGFVLRKLRLDWRPTVSFVRVTAFSNFEKLRLEIGLKGGTERIEVTAGGAVVRRVDSPEAHTGRSFVAFK